MRIVRERNILPKTDYAPTFNIPIGVAKFDEEKTGIIKKQNASRNISRVTKKISSL